MYRGFRRTISYTIRPSEKARKVTRIVYQSLIQVSPLKYFCSFESFLLALILHFK